MSLTSRYSTAPSRTVGRLLHLSFRETLEGRWKPRLPDGTELPEGNYPEPEIPRISFSHNVEQCFRGVYPNIYHLFEEKKYPYLTFHAYVPVFKGTERVVCPDVLTNHRMVWDAHVTREHWVLDAVVLKKIGSLKIFNTNRSETLMTHPFDTSSNKKQSVGPKDIKWESGSLDPSWGEGDDSWISKLTSW